MNKRQTSSRPATSGVLDHPSPGRHFGRETTPNSIDTGRMWMPRLNMEPSVARIYDYLHGGKDNFCCDREFAHRLLELVPNLEALARANRDFVGRVVRHLAEDHGIRQFIDIGTGLPRQENVHQMAQEIHPEARTVYVDNDPMVLAHARAFLADEDRVTVVWGDLRRPDGFLTDEATRNMIDFAEPVAVLAIGILHFLTADDDPHGAVKHIREIIAPGSRLAVSHIAVRPETVRAAELMRHTGTADFGRTKAEIAAFFDGFELERPGLVSVSDWRPGLEDRADDDVWLYAGLGRRA